MSNEELTQLAYQVYGEQQRNRQAPPLEARFYPYANLNHTVRLRSGRIYLRLSDIMHDAPVYALRTIITILLLKLDRRRVHPELEASYRAYTGSVAVRDKIHEVRRSRGRKMLSQHAGKFFDLRATFDQLNRRYFDGKLHVSALTWSRGDNMRILGHYDRCHDVIVISRSLDVKGIPALLLEFILFHEMLHAHSGERYCNGKRHSHHREFRIAEKRFHRYREARELMRRFAVRIS